MIVGVHHMSRTVSDLDQSLAFYRDLLGMPVELDTEMQGAMLEREVAMPGAHLRICLLRAGADSVLELLQYLQPVGAPVPPGVRPADVGAHHVALLVDDIRASYDVLTRAGSRVHLPAARGRRWLFPRTLDSVLLRPRPADRRALAVARPGIALPALHITSPPDTLSVEPV